MLDRQEFDSLVRAALSELFDPVALETHPLTKAFPRPDRRSRSRGEHLRDKLVGAIESLRPTEGDCQTGSRAWRPYLVLSGRYIEGTSSRDLRASLSISERQLRREHARGVRAVAGLLWDQVRQEPGSSEEALTREEAELEGLAEEWPTFRVNPESLNVAQVVLEAARILEHRAKAEGATLVLALGDELPMVQADRVILRQILFSLLGYALSMRSEGEIEIGTSASESRSSLWLQFCAGARPLPALGEASAALQPVRYWAQRLDGTLHESRTAHSHEPIVRLTLSLPCLGCPAMLVVDDQEPAMIMFRRYMSRTGFRVIGARQPDRALSVARQLQPEIIVLDVMMPSVDGWEVLQALKIDPDTRDIPVIVCSAWDEPELACALGAADFLKKPITRKHLLSSLARLGLVDIAVGSSSTSTGEP